MQVEWDQKKYTTGFAHIDEQHRNLFDGLNGLMLFLEDSSIFDKSENKAKVIEMIDFIGNYTSEHFSDEEKIFEKYNHPLMDANKEAHQMFLAKYAQYQSKLADGKLTRALLIQMHIFLRGWLINHILKIDTSLCDCEEKATEEVHDNDNSEKKTGIFSRFFSLFKI